MNSTIVSAFIGAGVAVLTILLKDYWLDKIKEDRKLKLTKEQTFKYYANPIIRSTESLCWRLKEIFEQRGAFLLERDPRNKFFEYKYVSTVYRLSSLIGWLRAVNREFAYIDTSESSSNRKIEEALISFQKALADGQHMELSILKELAKCWTINIETIPNDEQAKLAVKIDDMVYECMKGSNIALAANLTEDEQNKLLGKIANLICDKAKCEQIAINIVNKMRKIAINEISRVENWIYRDWQNAIGDLMLKEINNSPRRFDVIGYGEFDLLSSQDNKWLERIYSLFDNLNVEVDDRFDARVGQLKRIYTSSVNILAAFNDFNKGQETISKESLKTLKDYRVNCNVL